MSQELRRRLFDELESIVLIDPHTHINALQPAAVNLADILGYHYYTELAHSCGLPRERIEEPGLSARKRFRIDRELESTGKYDSIQLAY